jgi:hypothetical protein
MLDPLSMQVLAWVGVALLLILCLPFAWIQKLVLELSAWALRLALLALIGAAAYLWFRPEDLPGAVPETLDSFPRLRAILPEPGTQPFAVCVASLIVVPLLPLLATLDVSRKLAGWRRSRLPALASGPKEAEVPPAPQQNPPPSRRVDRRAAADTLAQASRKPFHPANPPE